MAGQARDWKSVDRWATNTKLSEEQKILLKRYYNDEKAQAKRDVGRDFQGNG